MDNEKAVEKKAWYMRPLLCQAVKDASQSKDIVEASKEWFLISRWKEEEGTECICGQQDCKDVYMIQNHYNGNLLSPIGSSCMEYFQFDEGILDIWGKWYLKLYRSRDGMHSEKPFCEVIKDVGYIMKLKKNLYYCNAEEQRLIKLADAVWKYNPPPEPPQPPVRSMWDAISESKCMKCEEQKKKGYKQCFLCYEKKTIKKEDVCQKCEEQKKKGYKQCYTCLIRKS